MRTTWPWRDSTAAPGRPGIVVVNYNTRQLIAQVIYSLYRNLQEPAFDLVVVDNGSTDGSQELLSGVADAGLCGLILNRGQRYHGPGLNQGVSYLAEAMRRDGQHSTISYVWILDSDCVVLRADALSAPCAVMRETGAALVGQRVYDDWNDGLMGLHSLLIDPAQVWRSAIPPFEEHGSPSEALQRACQKAGLLAVDFPYTKDGYVVHLGRGSLREIARTEDQTNRYYEWATTHNELHFAGEAGAPAAYAEFRSAFARDVPTVDAVHLIDACR